MTCRIPLNENVFAYVDDEDFKRISRYTWTRFVCGNTTYAVTSIDGCLVMMHRMVLNYYEEDDIDHRNQNGLDNRKHNIWIAGRSMNNLNRSITTGVKTRILSSGSVKFDSRVQFQGVSYHLGTFSNYDAAIRMAAFNRRRLLSGGRPIALKRANRWSTLKKVTL